MNIKVSITYQPKNQDWPSLITQSFESWQKAFKEAQKLINKFVRVRDAHLLNLLIEEVQ